MVYYFVVLTLLDATSRKKLAERSLEPIHVPNWLFRKGGCCKYEQGPLGLDDLGS